MKKLIYICILGLFLTGYHKNTAIESSVSESFVQEESAYMDITSKVEKLKSKYELALDFGKKHGLLYIDGTPTNGNPIMDEITPLKVGDKVSEKKKIILEAKEYKPVFYETDVNVLSEIMKDFTRDEVYDYLINVNEVYPTIYIEGIEDSIEALNYLLCNMGYGETDPEIGVVSLETLESMSDIEFKEHVCKVLSYSNDYRNQQEQSFSDYIKELYSETKEVLVDDYKDRDSEYQEWYVDNIDIISDSRYIDFTQDVLPQEVILKDGRYYLDTTSFSGNQVKLLIYGKEIYIDLE